MNRISSTTELDAGAIMDFDLRGRQLIEASAGTGKTHTIADLYLRHVLDGRQLSEILIVTYTNAATEELRGRIHRRLYQAMHRLRDAVAGDEFLERLGQRWQELDADAQDLQLRRLQLALRSMEEASISTIHSFCQSCLQDYAFSGSQLFDSELLANDDPLWENAIKDWWRQQTYSLGGEDWKLVSTALKQVDHLTAILLELRNRPGAHLLPQARASLAELLQQAREITTALRELAPMWREQQAEIVDILSASPVLSRAQTLPYHPRKLPELLEAADGFFNTDEALLPFDNFEYMGTDWLDKHSTKAKRGQDPRLQQPFFQALNRIASSWREFSLELAPQLQIAAFTEVSRRLRESKRETAVLAFQDQLNLLLEALESNQGETLAQQLRQQYPVAMIDEFQDTDGIQYNIFNRIYNDSADCCLTLIGDPKQAIYSFRGGDIFTYMRARSRSDLRRYSLRTNWRSQPQLVQAINKLFTFRNDAFIYSDSIDFSPASAVAANELHALRLGGQPVAAMALWELPQKNDGENYTRDEMRQRIYQAVVGEIAALLNPAASLPASIDGRPVESGDIAILVRQASEGQALSRLLHQQGIRTVTIGRDSVFHSDEASGLFDLLLAISQHRDVRIASRSLASSLLGLDYRQIAEIVDSDANWQDWLDNLAELHRLWQRQGFIAMFQSLQQRFDLASKLASQSDNERRLTNLLHLSELLQQQSCANAGIAALLGWYRKQFDEPATDAAELRLEDDEALVKIVTIHKSKGLQYPIVFVPFLWSCRPVERNRAVYFHDDDLRPCFDLGSPALAQNRVRAEKERLAEDLRLLYVALTRARSRVYLAWGKAGAGNHSGYASETALAYLLHSRQTPEALEATPVDGFPDGFDLHADLSKLIEHGEGSIELQPLPQTTVGQSHHGDNVTSNPLKLAAFSRGYLPHWRINSFTGLTRGIHQPANFGEPLSQGDAILDFPAGSHIGLLLHSLLEHLDFQQALAPQCRLLFERFLPESGLGGEHEEILLDWLEQIIATPLDGQALCLNQLPGARRLNEFEFDFALDHLDIDALNHWLQSLTPIPIQAATGANFGGLITGVIDLVFEYQGRYYLADYKSNFLGAGFEDYAPSRLQQAMLQRRYDLQSLIYSVALHRYLTRRLPNYDYAQHFGGSYYLFLRAMRPQHGNRFGVHFERPDSAIIEHLDRLLRYVSCVETKR